MNVKSANLLLKFLLELAALASFAIWGAETGSGVVAVVLAIAAPLAMVVLWGRFAAPRAPGRLSVRTRIPFELTVFALAVVGLLTVGHTVAAIVLAGVVVVNSLALTAFDQWEG
jgi:hypothetical protein